MMTKILLVLLLIKLNSLASISAINDWSTQIKDGRIVVTTQKSNLKKDKYRLGGATLGENASTLDSSFTYINDMIDIKYTKKLSKDYAPFTKVLVSVTPKSKKICQIVLSGGEELGYNLESCTKTQDAVMKSIFHMYGGEYSHERPTNTLEVWGNQEVEHMLIGEITIDKDRGYGMSCGNDSINTPGEVYLYDKKLSSKSHHEHEELVKEKNLKEVKKQKKVIDSLLQ